MYLMSQITSEKEVFNHATTTDTAKNNFTTKHLRTLLPVSEAATKGAL